MLSSFGQAVSRGCLALGLVLPALLLAQTPAPSPTPAVLAFENKPLRTELEQRVHAFAETGSVLYVAAHPDDENTHLITFLARGRGLRTAYLSLTRGDGGQNESGPEFGEKLGLARTYELLAARALDSGHQYFTRALDFGFSKEVDETLRIWNRREVLADTVRVIREFQPDVIVTRFSPEPGGTHGHHTASAVLALEAFSLSGDPTAFPEQLARFPVWQPRRILQNMSPWNPKPAPQAGPVFKMEINGRDAVTGQALASIAAQSRARHITQGFANFGAGAKPNESRLDSFAVLAGDAAATDLLDGIDTSWRRYPGGESLQATVRALVDSFDPQNPARDLAGWLALRATLATWPDEPRLRVKRQELDDIILSSLGVRFETLTSRAEVAPGESLTIEMKASLAASASVRWISTNLPSLKAIRPVDQVLQPGQHLSLSHTFTLPSDLAPSQPYWLREPARDGLFTVRDDSLIGRPTNPPALPLSHVVEIGGQTFVVADTPVQKLAEVPPAQVLRPLEIIAPVSLSFDHGVQLFAPGETKTVTVTATAARSELKGELALEVADGWTVVPKSQPLVLATAQDRLAVTFQVTAPAKSTSAEIGAVARVSGAEYRQAREVIQYSHLPVLLLQPPASLKAVSLQVEKRGNKVGYLPGAGDDTAEALAQLGYDVVTLSGADLKPEVLNPLDAVVIGVRAFNERTDLADKLPALFAYAEQGGNVIAQYNRPGGLKTTTLAPYALSIAGEAPRLRVTDENAAVTFLITEHPVLNLPNRLTAADFEGWVQERGAYYPKTWDEQAFAAILAMNDPGEEPLRGSLLVARHGQGHFVYTGLSFFRQLPQGVPGAYRLFANLVSLGR